MQKTITEEIKIPERVEVNIDGNTFDIRGPRGENKREFKVAGIIFERQEEKIVLRSEKATKREKKMMNTIKAHISNMIKGVQEKFEYRLKVCFSHFPIKVDIEERGGEKWALIKNFGGEKIPRKVKIPESVEIKVDGDLVTISSSNKEAAGQSAADFERATRIKMRDRRVFQDGIFIINKAGKEI